jgi:hypothetical protein
MVYNNGLSDLEFSIPSGDVGQALIVHWSALY